MAKSRASNKRQWARKPSGAKELPHMAKVMASKRKPGLKATAFTMEEKLQCLELYAELGNADAVAVKLNRSPDAVRKYLWRYRSTTKAARLTLEGGAERLANRILKDANVEESLEIMDRLEVLEKKRDKAAPTSSFSLIIGMPGHANIDQAVPVPSQKQIEAAIDAQAVEVEQ